MCSRPAVSYQDCWSTRDGAQPGEVVEPLNCETASIETNSRTKLTRCALDGEVRALNHGLFQKPVTPPAGHEAGSP